MAAEGMSPEEVANRLSQSHPLTADQIQRVVALLLSVGASGAMTR